MNACLCEQEWAELLNWIHSKVDSNTPLSIQFIATRLYVQFEKQKKERDRMTKRRYKNRKPYKKARQS